MPCCVSLRRYVRSVVGLALMLAGSMVAHGSDTFNGTELTIPSMVVGAAIYSNVVVTPGTILQDHQGTPNGSADQFDPVSQQLMIPSVVVGTTTYTNVLITVASLFSIGGVSGADSFDGAHLLVSSVQVVGGPTYNNVVATVGRIVHVGGGMPTLARDQYDPATQYLSVPAVVFGGKVYTNVVVTISGVVAFATISSVIPSCLPASLQVGLTAQCSAAVKGTGSFNGAVTWSVGGIPGGNAVLGTVSAAGVYAAPGTVPATNPVTVTATSSVDPTKSNSIPVTITPLGISISSLSATAINPLATLTITGSGFTASRSTILSVRFIPQGGAPVITVPASAASATSIQVLVPPLYDPSSAGFVSGAVAVQVIEVAASVTSFSNAATGLTINALPAVPSGVAAGAITAAYLASGLNVAISLQTLVTGNATYGNLAAPLASYGVDLAAMGTAVNIVVADSTKTVAIALANGTTTALSAATLAISDRLILAAVTGLVGEIPITIGTSFTNCPSATGNATFDNDLCSLQNSFQNVAVVKPPLLMRPSAQSPAVTAAAQKAVASLIIGSIAVVVCPECGLAYELFVATAGTYATSLAIEGATPPATDTVGGLATTYADHLADLGIPVAGPALDLYRLMKLAAEDDPPDDSSLPGPGFAGMLPGGITAVLYPGSGGAPTATLLRVPAGVAQETIDSTKLVLPPQSTDNLVVGVTGPGSVDSFPAGIQCGTACSAGFPVGVPVALTAVPGPGAAFQSWSGACSGAGACTVTMGSAQTVTALFTQYSSCPNGATDYPTCTLSAVLPGYLQLGDFGGCAGATLTTAFEVSAATGVTWRASIDAPAVGGGNSNVTPGGAGAGVINVTITVPPQVPTATCNLTYNLSTFTNVYVTFSDGAVIGVTVYWTFIGVT